MRVYTLCFVRAYGRSRSFISVPVEIDLSRPHNGRRRIFSSAIPPPPKKFLAKPA